MKKRLLSMLLCAAMVAAMVVGCGSKEEAPAEDAATEESAEGKAGDVNGDGKIVVGYISKKHRRPIPRTNQRLCNRNT